MVSLDFIFRSILIEEIVEGEGALWADGSISWLSINRGSYCGKRVQVVDSAFLPCVGVLSGASYFREGSWIVLSVWFHFCVFLANKTQKTKHKTQDCIQTYFLPTTGN